AGHHGRGTVAHDVVVLQRLGEARARLQEIGVLVGALHRPRFVESASVVGDSVDFRSGSDAIVAATWQVEAHLFGPAEFAARVGLKDSAGRVGGIVTGDSDPGDASEIRRGRQAVAVPYNRIFHGD